ncbi:peptide deformylase [Mycoplasma bradburyae]|uniref:Peptide deformylase n=1 Tax=Mycoplasma bradburyae TaxID=2963128 RepID=A0AAW6HPI2_9MOLU|nr:peptide deformylase [Mycoplasma bradburyae]MDC4182184.1 peptide deformylase [Mycoplasma bradburyae]MDC4182954.1 peptide deformylase [Mycoplasma bradburyae]MDC4183690.1 peptide deformylase [Mycoplasma bradburyae]MDC4184371.1 peptide deformylase [Mycoplasma bradburyae]UTS70010.1 peptide deformylase [Mycoplasma bradburyae]
MKSKLKPTSDWLVTDQNPKMREVCSPVTFPISEEVQEAIDKMISYVDESFYDRAEQYDIRPGIGIAANQIGLNKRMFYIHFTDFCNKEHKYFLMNPEWIEKSVNKAYIGSGEGCLSVPTDKDGYVIRCEKVKLKGFDYLTQKEVVIKAHGLLSMCLQHEMDHLEGKFYYDSINTMKPFFKKEEWVCVEQEDCAECK